MGGRSEEGVGRWFIELFLLLDIFMFPPSE